MRTDPNPRRHIMAPTKPNASTWIFCIVLLSLWACSSNKPYSINLMPAPDIYALGEIDPLPDIEAAETFPYHGILYATDRAPAGDGSPVFLNERGHLLRVGIGNLVLGDTDFSWEEARRISLLKNRAANYPIKVESINRLGILDRSISVFTDPSLVDPPLEKPREQFVDLINRKLAISERNDIYIYVHGYKVGFENPLLVASELWHFLGYDGVFIAYAWPSTPRTLAYASDLETAVLSANYLKLLIEVLGQETRAENIHIVGYSAGTRVVLNALFQMALTHEALEKEAIVDELKIGHVILVGSDFDRQLFGAFLDNGLLNVPRKLTVYMSEKDKAMGVSQWVFGRERLGSMWKEGQMPSHVSQVLELIQDLEMINVTDAEGAATGNGHAYFRQSPWVSSDVLMSLMYDLAPENRGLEKMKGEVVWTFPEDYVQRFLEDLKKANPDLFK